jgi:hypothetical protein
VSASNSGVGVATCNAPGSEGVSPAEIAAMAASLSVRSDSEDLGLRSRKLLVGEDALSVEVRQILKLRGGVVRGLRRLLVLRLLRVLLRVLRFPSLGLTALDAPVHSGGGSGDDGCPGCHS